MVDKNADTVIRARVCVRRNKMNLPVDLPPEGLSRAVLERADAKWSLSRLTLPHPLVRIVVAEQVYRAWSLLKGHPYHR